MSIADLYDISRAVRREKAREQGLLPIPTSLATSSPRACNICFQQPAKYNCPKCNIPYCSLLCFRAEAHQSCATTFSETALRSHVDSEASPIVEAREREKVFDILQRVETQDIEQRQRAEEVEEDSEEDDDTETHELDTNMLDLDSTKIESASVQDLLQMLTPKERQTFERALQSPAEAQKLMERLERKADRLRLDKSDASIQRASSPTRLSPAIVRNKTEQSDRDLIANVLTDDKIDTMSTMPQRRNWQSQPWFESQAGFPSAFVICPDTLDNFASELTKLLAASAPQPGAMDLTFNLAAVLMAYSHVIRRFDVECLSDILMSVPSSSCAGSEAFIMLDRLVPFLTQSSSKTPESASSSIARSRDPSKIVFKDLDDAVLSLLSRLSYEEELTNADQLRLQLLTDLCQLTHQIKIISIAKPGKSEPRDAVSSRLTTGQHVFAASQHSAAVNAVADLFAFFELSSKSVASRPLHTSSRIVKSAQRKLCFYLVNTIFRVDQFASCYHRLPDMVKASLAKINQEISNAEKTDKVAMANKLTGNGNLDARYE